jgi:hypothetical protein
MTYWLGSTLRYQTYADNSLANTDDKRFIPVIFAQDEWKLLPEAACL